MTIPSAAAGYRVFPTYSALLFAAVFGASYLMGCGQQPPEVARTTAPLGQEKKVAIPGTHVVIVPPKNFKLSHNSAGLEHAGGAGISVIDLAGGNFFTNAATFNRQQFEAQDITVFAYQDTVIDGYPGKYAYVQSNTETKTHVLTFGDTTFCALVTGLFPAADEAMGAQIKRAIFSTTYNKKAVIDPMAIAPFTIDESQSKFEFALFSGNMYTYTVGGKKSSSPVDLATVVMVPVPADNESAASFSEYIMEKIDSRGMVNKVVKNESHARINGYDAYEAEVYGRLQGVDTLIYVLYLEKDDNGIFIQGIAPTNYAGNLVEFKKFTRTLRFKS